MIFSTYLEDEVTGLTGVEGVLIAMPDSYPKEMSAITLLMKVTTGEMVSSLEFGNIV